MARPLESSATFKGGGHVRVCGRLQAGGRLQFGQAHHRDAGPHGASRAGRRRLWRSADRHCTFGHRRLSIIDLSDAAAQPMLNARGTVAVIVQRRDLQPRRGPARAEALGKYQWQTDHSDTEVLLHAYEEWGLDCVNKFYGMFALAIYDAPRARAARSSTSSATASASSRSISRGPPPGEWLFASEIRALARPSARLGGDGSAPPSGTT